MDAKVLGIAAAIIVIILIVVVSMNYSTLPTGITNGMVVTDNVSIYKIVNNKKCWYSGPAYIAAGSPTRTVFAASVIASIPNGPNM